MKHTLAADPTHSVWDRALPPRLHIAPGDEVDIQCVDASGAQVHPGMTTEQYLAIDRTRIHALTGPIYIDGAEPGDVLQIDVLQTRHHGWGWTSVIEGLGFLKDHFRDPYLFHWQLDADTTHSLGPAIVPVRPFPGVMGVARADAGAFRTRPPGPFGGNLDVRELCAGSSLYLPVFTPGALFSCGDGHAAQGDGEVCINGIECPLDLTLRFHLHKQQPLTHPIIESNPGPSGVILSGRQGSPDSLLAGVEAKDPGISGVILSKAKNLGISDVILSEAKDPRILPGPPSARNSPNPDSNSEWIVVETGPDLVDAARAATLRMIDLLVTRWGFTPIHAYILCSVAMRLRLSQVVNEPIHTVSAAISKQILPPRKLFPLQ